MKFSSKRILFLTLTILLLVNLTLQGKYDLKIEKIQFHIQQTRKRKKF